MQDLYDLGPCGFQYGLPVYGLGMVTSNTCGE
jgi:hypothetical protein